MKNKFLRRIFLISIFDFGIFILLLAVIAFDIIFGLNMFYPIIICSALCVLLYAVLLLFSIFQMIKAFISLKAKGLPVIIKIIGINITTAIPSYLIITAAMTLAKQ